MRVGDPDESSHFPEEKFRETYHETVEYNRITTGGGLSSIKIILQEESIVSNCSVVDRGLSIISNP